MQQTVEYTRQAQYNIATQHLENSMSYEVYMDLMERLVKDGKSSAQVQSEGMSNYTKLNFSRMKRIAKTLQIPEYILQAFRSKNPSLTWLVITESWCGDAAQSMPVMKLLADLAASIDLRVILRDEYPELMDAFLYKDTRSIPVLIALDKEQEQLVGVWGPRPSTANDMVATYKAEHGGLTAEFKKDLQVWYNKDKGQTILEDLNALIK